MTRGRGRDDADDVHVKVNVKDKFDADFATGFGFQSCRLLLLVIYVAHFLFANQIKGVESETIDQRIA